MKTKEKLRTMKEDGTVDWDQEFTNAYIEKLENTKEQKVRTPWGSAFSLPRNALTGQEYSGINSLMAIVAGRSNPEWITYKQMVEYEKLHDVKLKLKPKEDRGESLAIVRAVSVVYGKGKSSEDGEEEVGVYFKNKYAGTVFNSDDIEGMLPPKERPPVSFMDNPEMELVIKALTTDGFIDDGQGGLKPYKGVKFEHRGGDRAYYSPSLDIVVSPEKYQFQDEQAAIDYYSVLMHEFGHAMGGKDRLARDQTGKFGSEAYAREELVAEFVSVFMSGKLGLSYDSDNHPNSIAYHQSWLRALKNDKTELRRAVSAAQRTVDLIENRVEQYKLTLTQELQVEIKQEQKPIEVLVSKPEPVMPANMPEVVKGRERGTMRM